jgi:hypothetical protein
VQTLKENGLTIDIKDSVLPSANMVEHRPAFNGERCYDSTANHPLSLSGFSSEYKTGFEFISFNKAMQLQSGGCFCTTDSTKMSCVSVSEYDLKETAVEVAHELRRIGGLNAGVFYDPCAGNESRCLLREQVIDFVNYLRNREVLPTTSVRMH